MHCILCSILLHSILILYNIPTIVKLAKLLQELPEKLGGHPSVTLCPEVSFCADEFIKSFMPKVKVYSLLLVA